MVEITSDIKKRFAPVFKVARRDKFRIVWLEQDLVYCARRGKGKHDRYLVRFEVTPDETVSIGCKSTTGRTCDGMLFKGLCAHAAAVILRGIPAGRKNKQQESEAA